MYSLQFVNLSSSRVSFDSLAQYWIAALAACLLARLALASVTPLPITEQRKADVSLGIRAEIGPSKIAEFPFSLFLISLFGSLT